MTVDPVLLEAVEAVWRIQPPMPEHVLSHPDVARLAELCTARYGGGARMGFSMLQLLRALGMPAGLAGRPERALPSSIAAEALEAGLSSTRAVVRHLVPLDMADGLPDLSFGPARIARFGTEELADLFDAPRLGRLYPNLSLDLARLAQFHWLVVEEAVELDPRPELRSVPILFTDLSGDLGAFDPHHGGIPESVQRALFFLLLAPWEDWSSMLGVNWRGFLTPWVYTVDSDIVAQPLRPPDPDTLSWTEVSFHDRWGAEIVLERPADFQVDERAQVTLATFDQAAWVRCEAAMRCSLFETPVVHFFVRAYQNGKIDEVMAHMTAIEAALGMESDHRRKLRPSPDPHPQLFSTDCVMARIAALLNDSAAGFQYKDLFQFRSEFVHGRRLDGLVSTEQRTTARRLARRVVAALVDLASGPVGGRQSVLTDLAVRGSPMIHRNRDPRKKERQGSTASD